MSMIADASLYPAGEEKIAWAKRHMKVLGEIANEFAREQPFAGLRIATSIHLEAKTACLARALRLGGAEVFATGCNPLSTQDDVCAALAAGGVTVYARHGCTAQEYHDSLCMALEKRPHVIIDDGGDMVQILHTDHPEYGECLIGGCEETTTGVRRLQARAKQGQLRFPMFNVNDADCKHLFDNRYGTGQSVWDGIMRTTNLIVAGKNVVVAGYGWCGKGVSMRAKGMGARVIVTEVDPVRAIEAVMDGFTVMPMSEAARIGDLFITVTGCADVVTPAHFALMKDGAVLCNAGHFDVEVNVRALRDMAQSVYQARQNIEGFELPSGRTLYVLAQGRLVNLASGDGHPVEIMDMSFALQALCVREMAQNGKTLAPDVYPVPRALDRRVALLKLSAMGARIDALTPAQEAYLIGYEAEA